MRILDAALAALGLLAVGLVVSSLPPSEVSAAGLDATSSQPGLDDEAAALGLSNGLGLSSGIDSGPVLYRTGLRASEEVRPAGSAGCCMNVNGAVDPVQRERFLNRLLVPNGDGPEAARDRARLKQLIQREGSLGPLWTPPSEREIS